MAWKEQKNGEIVMYGFEAGIAPSPYDGIADLKGVNISSIKHEVSLAYDRVRLDQPSITGAFTTNGTHSFVDNSNLNMPLGTWVKITAVTGTTGLTVNNYYFIGDLSNITSGSYALYSDFDVTRITGDSGTGSATYETLAMGVPIDYVVENYPGDSGPQWRYYVLDDTGIIWVSGTDSSNPGVQGALSTTTTFSALTPSGTHASIYSSSTAYNAFSMGNSISIMYATSSTTGQGNKITAAYMIVFTDYGTLSFRTDSSTYWPSNGGTVTALAAFNYYGYSHKSILGNDQVIYFTDGPNVGVIQQVSGQEFDPTTTSTYVYETSAYYIAPSDSATTLSQLTGGSGIQILVGGVLNNLYIFASYQASTTTVAPQVLWMPEAYTFNLLQVNNYVLIFPGNKGNIYLTNGSSVVPILTIPDYVAGAGNFVQDPYFVWGGATYMRGRVFFSIKDQNSSHTGNCGGVWSFVPSFSYFINQDVGQGLRMESASSLYATYGFDGYATVLFAGNEETAQENDGPQYIACWNQADNDGKNTTNSIDFSGTSPITNSSAIIETDAIPVGTFLKKRTFKQVEIKFSSALVSGESITLKYRTDLESSWTSAGTLIYDTTNLSAITKQISFEKSQIIQFRLELTGTATSPSWIRIKEMYLR